MLANNYLVDRAFRVVTRSCNHLVRRILLVSLLLMGFSVQVHAQTPILITPQLPPATHGQAYSETLVVASTPNATSSTVTGLPAGLSATSVTNNTITIAGTSTVNSGNYTLAVSVTNGSGTANFNISLTLNRFAVAQPVGISSIATGLWHTCAVIGGGLQCWGANERSTRDGCQ